MTGPEIVAGLAAGAKGAKKVVDALGGDAKEQEQLSRLAEDTKALEVAANARADRVAIRQLVLTKLYAPLAKWVGYKSEYFESQFADDMAEKLADVPEEHITSPSPVVAAQSMEGLSYSLDEPDLKEMYLNLLATASDDRRSREAHPSYAQIIKQLSSTEAAYLKGALGSMHDRSVLSIAELRSKQADGSGLRAICSHLIELYSEETGEFQADPDYPLYIDNWVRLGLATVSYEYEVTRKGAYDWVKEHPEYLKAATALEGDNERVLEVAHGIMRGTDLGRKFYDAVSGTTTG
ncbi:DUF4393 domain-containing protein [Cellulosimicrobium cellulans]|uniref:DUF4393 domain-containing protein n=1 Tax=Cellulosimicrobium cellulans TaxID=1710 RepID=UPI001EDBDF5D|nr:DUF4393 domain-containing protein [Cellulosimicrobium cellulans]UKJ63710.1 DUF4393 domain-containing protein [Cellulosimicrobium cellulans]